MFQWPNHEKHCFQNSRIASVAGRWCLASGAPGTIVCALCLSTTPILGGKKGRSLPNVEMQILPKKDSRTGSPNCHSEPHIDMLSSLNTCRGLVCLKLTIYWCTINRADRILVTSRYPFPRRMQIRISIRAYSYEVAVGEVRKCRA